MDRFTIKVVRGWLNDEEALVRRIAKIVKGTDEGVRDRSKDGHGGFKWAIHEPSNDWFASGVEGGEITIAYRYGGGSNFLMMESLRIFIQWLISPDLVDENKS